MLDTNQNNIEIQAAIHPQRADRILVRGKFNVECGQSGVPANPPSTLKHIVLVVTRGASYQALNPFSETVVFADDVKTEGKKCSAVFNMDVMDHISFGGAGDYYILCSLGTHVSNIVKVSLG